MIIDLTKAQGVKEAMQPLAQASPIMVVHETYGEPDKKTGEVPVIDAEVFDAAEVRHEGGMCVFVLKKRADIEVEKAAQPVKQPETAAKAEGADVPPDAPEQPVTDGKRIPVDTGGEAKEGQVSE